MKQQNFDFGYGNKTFKRPADVLISVFFAEE